MPWTLWRYTFFELWRLVLLSTAVLVTVIAFAAAVKPLADGDLSAVGAVKFMVFAIPPMLAFALPFAAGFGTTLAYHRMAQDNEMTAAHAGGLSHRAILVPALVSGVLLAGCLAMLNEQVIPRFLQRMEVMVTRDLAKILEQKIGRGEAAEFGKMAIYADRIESVPPDSDSPLMDRLLLTGAAAVETDAEGRVITDATAERVWVLLFPGEMTGFDDRSLAGQLVFENGVGFQDGQRWAIDRTPTDPFRVPNAFEDDPKFLTFGELAALRDEPERMNFINSRRVKLAQRLGARDTVRTIRVGLEKMGRSTLNGGADSKVQIEAAGLKPLRSGGWLVEPDPMTGVVAIEQHQPTGSADGDGPAPDRSINFISARRVTLTLDRAAGVSVFGTGPDADDSHGMTVKLVAEQAAVRSRASGVPVERAQIAIEGLSLEGDPTARYSAMTAEQLLAEVARQGDAGARYEIDTTSKDLRERVVKLGREITSKQHERWAQAASCLVMVLTGAVMALKLRDAMPLIVYLWSFFPALATLILISSGQQHTHGESVAGGLPILWSGVAALGVYAGFNLIQLSRH